MEKYEVIMADRSVRIVEGKGIVAIKYQTGTINHIHGVQYVPSLSQNLLSVGQLFQRQYKLIFDNDQVIVFDKDNSSCGRHS